MAQAIDPVCGMTVDTDSAQFSSEYQGNTYYFCAAGCKRTFDKNPAGFTGGQSEQAGDVGHGGHGGHSGHHA